MFLFYLTAGLAGFVLSLLLIGTGAETLGYFGGSSMVWTAHLTFFLAVNLIGAFYARFLTRGAKPQLQAGIHIMIAALSLGFLQLRLGEWWLPAGTNTFGKMFQILAMKAYLPGMLICGSFPVLNAWSRRGGGGNIGAPALIGTATGLVAALPLYVAGALPLAARSLTVSAIWVCFVLGVVGCALRQRGFPTQPRPKAENPQTLDHVFRIATAFCGVFLLLAATARLSQQWLTTPLLWLGVLGIWVAALAVATRQDRPPSRTVWLSIFALAGLGFLLRESFAGGNISGGWLSFTLISVALLSGSVASVGEFFRRSKAAREAEGLWIDFAWGGVWAGAVAMWVSPLAFGGRFDLMLALLLIAVILGLSLAEEKNLLRPGGEIPWAQKLWLGAMTVMIVLSSLAFNTWQKNSIGGLRNAHGELRIYSQPIAKQNHLRSLWSGPQLVAQQFTGGPMRVRPIGYHGPNSGLGLALRHGIKRRGLGGRRIGVLGLGAGAVAAHGKGLDKIRVYQANIPATDLIRRKFYYLSDAAAPVEIVRGDERASLEGSTEKGFDLIVIDLARGDQLPVRLLTREAFAEYLRHLRPSGGLAFHVTHPHLNYEPVIHALASDAGKLIARVNSPGDPDTAQLPAQWIIVGANEAFINRLPQDKVERLKPIVPSSGAMWTDDQINLLTALK